MNDSKKEERFRRRLAKIADTSKPFSVSGLYFLTDLGSDDRRVLEEEWSAIDANRRRRIVKALIELSEDSIEFDFSAVFQVAMKDEDEEIRADAIEGLWENDSCVVLARLLDCLKNDRSALVKASAASALSRFSYMAEIGKLTERWVGRLRADLLAHVEDVDETPDVRRRCLEAVAYFSNDDEIRDSIERAYQLQHHKMRASAIHAMGRQMDAAWVPLLVSEMANPDPEIRYEAARSCGEIGSHECVEPLARLVEDSDPEVQLAAISALGQIGGAEARNILRQCRNSKDTGVREAAEEALEEIMYNSDPLGILGHGPD